MRREQSLVECGGGGTECEVANTEWLLRVSVCLLSKGIDLVLSDIPTAGGKRSG